MSAFFRWVHIKFRVSWGCPTNFLISLLFLFLVARIRGAVRLIFNLIFQSYSSLNLNHILFLLYLYIHLLISFISAYITGFSFTKTRPRQNISIYLYILFWFLSDSERGASLHHGTKVDVVTLTAVKLWLNEMR